MAELTSARVHAIVAESARLRDEELARAIGAWTGPIKRVSEPPDLPTLLLDLDTPSLFESASLWVVRADDKYLKRHNEALIDSAAKPVANGVLLLVAPSLDAKSKLAKALTARRALVHLPSPGPKEVVDWLGERLSALPGGVERARDVAEELVEHIGGDVDALLATADTAALYAWGGPLTVAAVRAVASGTAERPIWEFTAAVLEGNAKRAIELLHAGGGLGAQPALSSLTSEARKLIACCETSDDADAAAWGGMRGRGNLYYARKRSRDLGKTTLMRLLQGMILAQRQLRQTGADGEAILEIFALNVQRVVRR
jgi:DNA polymerase III delta subunit